MANKTTNFNLTKPTADDFYNVDVPNGNMDIIDAELKKLEDGKAPSGHGLGDRPEPYHYDLIKHVMQHGSGFYQIDSANDNPTSSSAWKPLLQFSTKGSTGLTSGVQVLMTCADVAKPNMFLRAIQDDVEGNWVEVIHTENATSLLPFVKIANGSFTGKGEVYKETSPLVLTFNFQPKVLFFNGMFSIPYGVTYAETYCDNLTNDIAKILLKWEGNNVLLYNNDSTKYWLGSNGTTYHYAAIG